MITTVVCASAAPADAWRAELLAYSWRRAGQPGELVHLLPGGAASSPATHHAGRVVETLSWTPHPFVPDAYAGYALPAALMEWLSVERVEGTLLLVDPGSAFVHPLAEEVEPGTVLANGWSALPVGDGGVFGLSRSFSKLASFCVNRALPLPAVTWPLLIHASDARKVAARWLELTGIIRAECADQHGQIRDADRVAYAIAAAEYRLRHRVAPLGAATDVSEAAALIEYARPVESPRGEIVWDAEVYRPWDAPLPEQARPGVGREFLALLAEFVSLRESNGGLAMVRPRRCPGVREARLLDELHLEIPGRPDNARLNPSASTIWALCDGERTLGDIAAELLERYEVSPETARDAVDATTRELEAAGALELEAPF